MVLGLEDELFLVVHLMIAGRYGSPGGLYLKGGASEHRKALGRPPRSPPPREMFMPFAP